MRRIDHLVVAVQDLDAAAAFYQSLGFQVGARNRHPWGTENRLIQFPQTFIELLTLGTDAAAIPDHRPGRFSFGAFMRDYLLRREGLAMLVLDSSDATADAQGFARQGLGSFEPFFFERKGRRPDGQETHVAFTLAFAQDDTMPECGFFVCQQHYPDNFWTPSFQQHENGARGIVAVGMTAADPSRHASFLSAFTGASAQPERDGGISFLLHDSLVALHPAGSEDPAPRFRSMAVTLPDLAAQAARLRQARVDFEERSDALLVPARSAFGLAIHFKAAAMA